MRPLFFGNVSLQAICIIRYEGKHFLPLGSSWLRTYKIDSDNYNYRKCDSKKSF